MTKEIWEEFCDAFSKKASQQDDETYVIEDKTMIKKSDGIIYSAHSPNPVFVTFTWENLDVNFLIGNNDILKNEMLLFGVNYD